MSTNGEGAIVSVVENDYLAARLAFTDEAGLAYWDLMRKARLTSGATPELLEVVVAALAASPSSCRIMIPVDDHDLFKDLQVLGCAWLGYAVSETAEDTADWDIWGGASKLRLSKLLEIEDVLASGRQSVRKIVLGLPTTFTHDPRWNVSDYLAFVRSRERYFIGISRVELIEPEPTDLRREPDISFPDPQDQDGDYRKISKFSDGTTVAARPGLRSQRLLSRAPRRAFSDSDRRRPVRILPLRRK
jgi:hypothetical protein